MKPQYKLLAAGITLSLSLGLGHAALVGTDLDSARGQLPGSTLELAAGAYRLEGSGFNRLDNTGDAFHFASESVTGDFDKRVRITSIDGASDWSRGGIMARESLEPISRLIKIVAANPNPIEAGAGANQVAIFTRTDEVAGYGQCGRAYGGVDAAVPNQWLRLKRVGNNFMTFVGVDGVAWSLVAEQYIPNCAAELHVGLLAASNDPSGQTLTTVEYASYSNTPVTDTTRPTLVSAGTLDKKIIGLKFSETLSSASVGTLANYTLSEGTVASAEVGASGESVYLTVNGLSSDNFTVTVSGVRDSAGNLVLPASVVSGRRVPYAVEDVGHFIDVDNRPTEGDDPYPIGRSVAVSSGDNAEIEIVAGGSNIWNEGDDMHFIFQAKTGDFDMQVEVTRSDKSVGTGSYGHSGLHVREALYRPGINPDTTLPWQYTARGTKVRTVMNTTYAEGNQERTAIAIWREAVDGGYGNSGVIGSGTVDANGIIGRWGKLTAGNASGEPLPNTSPTANRWLRLRRTGNEFHSYWSYNGVNWTEYDVRTQVMPATVQVGFASMSDTPGKSATIGINRAAHFVTVGIRNFGDVPSPLVGEDLDPARGQLAGSTTVVGPGAYRLEGSGFAPRDNTGDTMHFASAAISGDFDKRVRVISIDGPTDWSRGGIMARESLAPISRLAKIVAANPNPIEGGAGANQVAGFVRADELSGYGQSGRSYGGVDAAVPDQWLRLKRVGNNFMMFVGVDGQQWSLITEYYIANCAASLNVGLFAGANSVDGQSVATVDYDNWSNTPQSDVTPPVLQSAGTLDGKIVGLKFSETLDSASAMILNNYSISEGTITAVEAGASGQSVYLTVDGLTSDTFTVDARDVRDSSGNRMSAATVTARRSAWTAVDVGHFIDPDNRPTEGDDPYPIGRSVAVSSDENTEVEIVAGGSNIWNEGDDMHFLYQTRTGNFDVQVEVTRSDKSIGTGSYGHTGLHVREAFYRDGINPDTMLPWEYTTRGTKVRTVMNTTYAEGNQERTAIAIWREAVDGGYGNSAVIGSGTTDINGIIGRWGKLTAGNARGEALANTSPSANRWLRLRREANEFHSYWSYDGINWTEYDVRIQDMPATVLVGFASMTDTPGKSATIGVNRAAHYATIGIRNFGNAGFRLTAQTLPNGQLRLTWTEPGAALESAPALTGPWTTVAGAVSPYDTARTGAARYFRLAKP